MKKSTKSNSKKKPVILIIALLLIIGACFAAYLFLRDDSSGSSAGKERNSVNYSGPTTEEQEAGDEQKDKIVNEEENQKPPETASVVISNTSQSGDVIRIRAFVSNAVESDGKCITTLSRNGSKVTKETAAFGDASSTQCGAIDFTRSQFDSSGTWQVSVQYESTKLSGSATATIDIE